MAYRWSFAAQRVTFLPSLSRRSDDTEADWSELASVDPTESRRRTAGFHLRPKAELTQERTPEAVKCKRLFGQLFLFVTLMCCHVHQKHRGKARGISSPATNL